MQRSLVVSSSPHLRNERVSTRGLMTDVVIALLPAAIASVWFFGGSALMLMLVATATAVLTEFLYQKMTGQRVTVGDMSAVVTGLLLAFNLPASAPWWLAVIGSVIAILLVKQIFGGVGNNFVNPALAARTILMLSWTTLMAARVLPHAGVWVAPEVADAIASVTPLGEKAASYSLWQLFAGDVPGMLGETSKLALTLGGLYLLVRRVIDWRIPVTFIATAFILFWIQTGTVYSVESGAQNALYQLLSGGLLLGAFFMATDYVTSPTTKAGKIVFGVGCGVLTALIRSYGGFPEGVCYSILIMNTAVGLIDRLTVPKFFGEPKHAA